MVVNFSKHRKTLWVDRETAIRSIEPNPARVVKKALLAPVPVSSEDVRAYPSVSIHAEVPTQKSKKSSKSKGKEVAPPTSKTKRSREVSEVEASRKKTSQGPLQVTATESEGTMVLIAHTPENHSRVAQNQGRSC